MGGWIVSDRGREWVKKGGKDGWEGKEGKAQVRAEFEGLQITPVLECLGSAR